MRAASDIARIETAAAVKDKIWHRESIPNRLKHLANSHIAIILTSDTQNSPLDAISSSVSRMYLDRQTVICAWLSHDAPECDDVMIADAVSPSMGIKSTNGRSFATIYHIPETVTISDAASPNPLSALSLTVRHFKGIGHCYSYKFYGHSNEHNQPRNCELK